MYIFSLILILFSWSAFASNSGTSYVHDIDYGTQRDDKVLLLLESGEVLKVPDEKIWKLPRPKSLVKVAWDNKRNITKLSIIDHLKPTPGTSTFLETYDPTTVSGNGTAKSYFNQSRISHGDTQCYNRAHVWGYELWKKYQVKSQKIFLFFSRKYIREHDFGWWFHVAPLLKVKSWGSVSEKVIDPRFITAPRDIQWWTDKFVSSNEYCKEIQVYSDYADYPYTRDCFVMKVPMYIYQPLDLEMLEVWGVEKNKFNNLDLKWAYKEAFQMDYEGQER